MDFARAMEDLADRGAVRDQILARGFDIRDDQIQSLRRAGCCRGNVLAEDDGGGRTRRGELDHAPAFAGEIGVQPPAELAVKRLGTIDVGYRDDNALELHVYGAALGGRVAGGAFLDSLGHGLFLSSWVSLN